MKFKINFLFLLILLGGVLSGCSSTEIQFNNKEQRSDIDYEIYFQGFLIEKTPSPLKIFIFTSQEDWEKFSKKYVEQGQRVASMDRSIEWNKEDLIYFARGGAKDGYVGTSGSFKGYQIKNNRIDVKFENPPQHNQILAVNNSNDDNVSMTYQIWTLVKKSSISKDLVSLYQYSVQ
ncbi:hypothetical protein [Falsibacillus pallidus]|uniref:hypothetical protein n=1 Tax=Falsibacillus pallidus TaxID=493781 RepID=UPI003D99BF10